MTKPTVCIAISAYNEEQNIKVLLKSLLLQSSKNYFLKKIYVFSDGSTDSTVSEVKKMRSSKICLLDAKHRRGKSYRMNQAVHKAHSDFLIFLDADIKISHLSLIDTLVQKQCGSKSDLVAVNPISVRGKTIIEKSLQSGSKIQEQIRLKMKEEISYLHFNGRLLSLSKNLYKTLFFPKDIMNDDAFIYFFAKENGYSVAYLPQLSIKYRSPSNYSDYIQQSVRFKVSKNELLSYFPGIADEYKLPKQIAYGSVLKGVSQNPFYVLLYILLYISSEFFTISSSSLWNICTSTKNVREESVQPVTLSFISLWYSRLLLFSPMLLSRKRK